MQWYAQEGDALSQDQHLVDVLTDKATVEITSPRAGRVLKLLAKPGDKVKIGQVIVVIGQEGESWRGDDKEIRSMGDGEMGSAEMRKERSFPSSGVSATPAVRKLAKELGIELTSVPGTGLAGRITEEDIRRVSSGVAPPAAPEISFGPETRVPFLGIRRKTAERMSLSQRTAAHVTHMDEADVADLVDLHKQLKAEFQKEGISLTILSFIIKAVGQTLREYPYLNAALDEPRQQIILKSYRNLSVAMDTDKGLVTPVLHDADKKSLREIAGALSGLVDKARTGKLDAQELGGGTFTITNIGSLGGLAATPIINYPETGILGVMKIVRRPVVKNDQVAIRSMLNLCLSFDHRVLDGAYAARFTTALIKRLENPAGLQS